MKRLQEPKAQRWRALAILNNGEEVLLRLGGSIIQIKEFYHIPFMELLPEDVRKKVEQIHLQKWVGFPDRGKWVTDNYLPIPH